MSTAPLVEFAEVIRRLRAECPWKAAQTHRSLQRYLLEETHETLEAIDDGDRTGDWSHLREELGDLLLQVCLHAAIAEERGDFGIDDVAADATAKMIRRNPHVFEAPGLGGPGASDLTPDEVNAEWERRKTMEKPDRGSVLDGLPPGLPALLMADKVLGRLDRVGGRDDASPSATSSTATAQTPELVGERLLQIVAQARQSGIDPEQALRDVVNDLARSGDDGRTVGR